MDRAGAGIRGILFTDVVGSTELRTSLGEHRADALRRAHDDLFGSVVARHDGSVLRWTGDGLKADFPTASAAVSAAVDMQRAVAKYSRSAGAVAAFSIRVGLSVGEVTSEDGDIHGVAVIEAARLEAMAAPGEILATELVGRLGRRRVDAAFEDIGAHSLKGLDEPVHVQRVIDVGAGAEARPVPRALMADDRFPMVGRAGPVEQATDAWAQARAGATTTILVAGQPGIGKSRFVAQIASTAHADGALVLAGVCDSELDRPYQPFAMAFGDVTTDDDELAAAVGSGEGSLGPLFPARRAGRVDQSGPSARFDLFESVVALLERLSAEQPVVLVLEDLQWATAPTVQLLRHVVREMSGTRLLVLATYRIDDIGASHPMHELLVELRSSPAMARIDLGALDVAHVAELLVSRMPSAPPANVSDLAARVRDESGGNPFFVCELLHHLSATGELDRLVRRGDIDRLPIPDSVREVVGQRLARLAPEATNVLSIAAVVGLSFDLDLLARLVDERPDHVLGIVEDVARVALVHEVAAGRFSFAHAIVRSTLLESASATRRALMHRRVAETIEELRPADHDELALHWQQAGVPARAMECLERAAQRDLEALAYESAARRYQTVLDHRRGHGGSDLQPLARAWLGLGLAQRAMGLEEYLMAIVEAGRLARKLRDPDLLAETALASVWPSSFFVSNGRTQTDLLELCEDALDAIGEADARRPRILCTLTAHLRVAADRDRRVALLAEALVLARASGDLELIGAVLVAEHLLVWMPWTHDRRAAIGHELGRLARATGDVNLQFFAGFFTAFNAVERGDVADAVRRLDALEPTVKASRSFYFGFITERLRVSIDIVQGRPDVQASIDALASRYAGTHADTAGTWSLQTAAVAQQRGTFGDLAPVMRTMVAESRLEKSWMAAYGMALLESGDRCAAMAVLDAHEEPDADNFWLATTLAWAELAVALERHDLEAQLFDALLPWRGQLGIVASGSMCVGLVSTTLGLLATAMGRPALAAELLTEAKERADAMGAAYESTRARRLLATAMRALGSGDQAATLLSEAGELAARHGFAGEQRHLATMAGVGPP